MMRTSMPTQYRRQRIHCQDHSVPLPRPSVSLSKPRADISATLRNPAKERLEASPVPPRSLDRQEAPGSLIRDKSRRAVLVPPTFRAAVPF